MDHHYQSTPLMMNVCLLNTKSHRLPLAPAHSKLVVTNSRKPVYTKLWKWRNRPTFLLRITFLHTPSSIFAQMTTNLSYVTLISKERSDINLSDIKGYLSFPLNKFLNFKLSIGLTAVFPNLWAVLLWSEIKGCAVSWIFTTLIRPICKCMFTEEKLQR